MNTKDQKPEERKKNIHNLYKNKYHLHPVFKYFYHCTSIKNLNSILNSGLISHNDLEVGDIPYTTHSNKAIVERRDKKTIGGKEVVPSLSFAYNVNDFVPFYLIPDSPAINGLSSGEDCCILAIDIKVIIDPEIHCIFSDGNAANNDTKFEFNIDIIDFALLIPNMKEAQSAAWQQTSLTMDGNFTRIKKKYLSSKEIMRVRNAEFLAFSMQGCISSEYIKHVHFINPDSFNSGSFDLGNCTHSMSTVSPLHLNRSQKFT